MKIAVAGTGYVGLVTGVCMAEKGHFVTCIDVDKNKITMLNNGKAPFYEEGLDQLLIQNRERLVFTMDFNTAFRDAEVIFIGVGTPEKKDGSANLNYVYESVKQIAESVEQNCIVVVKSTVPIGTNDKLEKMLNDNCKPEVHIEVVSNPEFLAQGTAVEDTLHPSRIIIGTENQDARILMEQIYREYDAPLLVMNRRSAEMVKYASNDFLALKISYINEIANLCEMIGADIVSVTKGMGYDARIGDKFLNAGIGYGGSCFPKDTKALHWLAHMNDYEIKTVKAAIEVNEQQKLRLLKKAKKYYDSFEGLKIAVLGLTFKPGTDDLREAPSLTNISILLEEGAIIHAWDPVGEEKFRRLYPSEIIYFSTIDEAIKDTDICFIFTEWEEIKQYDINKFKQLMKKSIVMDGRNCIAIDRNNPCGISYEGIGRIF